MRDIFLPALASLVVPLALLSGAPEFQSSEKETAAADAEAAVRKNRGMRGGGVPCVWALCGGVWVGCCVAGVGGFGGLSVGCCASVFSSCLRRMLLRPPPVPRPSLHTVRRGQLRVVLSTSSSSPYPSLPTPTHPTLPRYPQRAAEERSGADDTMAPRGQLVFAAGVGSLVFVPVFKQLTGLPPFLGMLLGLGGLWVLTDAVHYGEPQRSRLKVGQALARIDTQGVLFFLGILMSVAAMSSQGLLKEVRTAPSIIGISSLNDW